VNKFLILLSLILSSCYQKPNKLRVNASLYTPPLKDCNNIMIRMKVLDIHDNLNPGSDFARVVAVDKQDGTMSVKILPPEGTTFPLKDELAQKELRFIACYENINSIKNGARFLGACHPLGVHNKLGGVEDVRHYTHLEANGFRAKVCNTEDDYCTWSYVHDTRNPNSDAARYMPTSIMFVASDGINHNEDYIIAIGDSPYKACYFSR